MFEATHQMHITSARHLLMGLLARMLVSLFVQAEQPYQAGGLCNRN